MLFDDAIVDKDLSREIELVRRQSIGHAHGPIKSAGMVNCMHMNSLTQERWTIDHRLYCSRLTQSRRCTARHAALRPAELNCVPQLNNSCHLHEATVASGIPATPCCAVHCEFIASGACKVANAVTQNKRVKSEEYSAVTTLKFSQTKRMNGSPS